MGRLTEERLHLPIGPRSKRARDAHGVPQGARDIHPYEN